MTGRRRRGQTVAEIEAEHRNSAKYQDMARERDEMLRKEAARIARAERPLVEDLRAAGAELGSVWDLVNSNARYPGLVPVLLSHLDRDYPEEVRDGIARALAVREAGPGWQKLLEAYERENGPVHPDLGVNQVKWSLHLALAAAADESHVSDLIRLVADKRNGNHRSFFIDALATMKDPRARAAIEEMRADPALKDAYQRLDKKLKARAKRAGKR